MQGNEVVVVGLEAEGRAAMGTRISGPDGHIGAHEIGENQVLLIKGTLDGAILAVKPDGSYTHTVAIGQAALDSDRIPTLHKDIAGKVFSIGAPLGIGAAEADDEIAEMLLVDTKDVPTLSLTQAQQELYAEGRVSTLQTEFLMWANDVKQTPRGQLADGRPVGYQSVGGRVKVGKLFDAPGSIADPADESSVFHRQIGQDQMTRAVIRTGQSILSLANDGTVINATASANHGKIVQALADPGVYNGVVIGRPLPLRKPDGSEFKTGPVLEVLFMTEATVPRGHQFVGDRTSLLASEYATLMGPFNPAATKGGDTLGAV